MDVDAHLRDPALKQRFVTPMFDIIAPRYDRFTRLFSFGMDRRWKEELLTDLIPRAPRGAVALDLACGTGDLALAIASRVADARVTGIDASPRMIALARERVAQRTPPSGGGRVSFEIGDMARLDVADASVDVVTVGYGLRNVPDFRVALGEIARVLKPNGRVATLDFYRPLHPLWRRLFISYLSAAGNVVGWWWHRQPVVYGYIARSLEQWVTWPDMRAEMRLAGIEVERERVRLAGGVVGAVGVRRSLPELEKNFPVTCKAI